MKRKWENTYKKIRAQRRPAIGLSIRMVLLVTVEFLAALIFSYAADLLINTVLLDWIISGLFHVDLYIPLLNAEFHVPFIVFILPSILFVGIFGTYFMSLWLFYPFKKLRRGFSRIADGDFSVRLSTRSLVKEIQELYAGFNLMADSIQSTEILQTDFVANASHEFKTPINAIEGYSMLLQDTENLSEEQKEYVDKILFNTKRLSSLTGSILLLSKIENQSINTDRTFFSLDEQIREAIVALEPLWAKKNVDFDVELEDTVYYGNELLMHHVWSNLISNAIKFGPENGVVKIRLKRLKDSITITVEDEGEGLTEEAKTHLFDKFYQGDSSHRSEGNGLGLALVKRILVLEDGKIYAANRKSGGCRFTVKLKLKKDPNKKRKFKIIDKIFKK